MSKMGTIFGVILFAVTIMISCNDSSTESDAKLIDVSLIDGSSTSSSSEYFIIDDPDGYSNLRLVPGGDVVRKVYETEKFEIVGEENNYNKVKFSDSSTGYIHNSRVVNLNMKVCECLGAANEIIKKDLDKDFSMGSETGFPDSSSPSFTERLIKIFQYNLSPKGCGILSDPSWFGIDIQSELQRCQVR